MRGETACRAIESQREAIVDLSLKVWGAPEGPFAEDNASRWAAQLLREQGFAVETGAGGMRTAFVATWGSGRPVIGFLGELDALPGLSQKVLPRQEPVEGQAYGQGCGHNLIIAGAVGAALGLQAEMREKGLGGTVVCYGCPAEETLNGKPFMARAGLFDGLDAAFSFHPMYNNEVSMGNEQGVNLIATNSVKFHFQGVSAHAATDPQNGRSAQDAVELMNVGANYLREHVTSDVRLHYAITETGEAPNIVPERATVWYFARATTRETLNDVFRRLENVARGAALMTETTVELEYLGACYETMQNPTLAALVHRNMQAVPQGAYTPQELAFAKALNALNPELTEKQRQKAQAAPGEEIHTGVPPITHNINFGSTDAGDVAHIAPTIFFTTACYNLGAPGHNWQVTACAGHSIGQKGMLYAAKIMAKSALDLLEEPALLDRAQEEFRGQMGGKTYQCPIPAEVPLPAGAV